MLIFLGVIFEVGIIGNACEMCQVLCFRDAFDFAILHFFPLQNKIDDSYERLNIKIPSFG